MTAPRIRQARPADAAEIARIYIESWQDTYPGVIPNSVLLGMSQKGQTRRWRHAIHSPLQETVLVAEDSDRTILGMTSLGPSRDRELGFGGEIYTLYVDPILTGRGIGRALLAGGFAHLRDRGYRSCVIWAHARNNARYFYEAMGGRLIAERTRPLMGVAMPEVAFGWKTLVLMKVE